jgi:MFS family permease
MMYQGYKVLIATFLNRFVALGALYSSGLFLVHLEHTFQVSRSIASLFPSIYGCMALLSALVAGYIQDLLINRDLPISLLFVLGGMMLGGGMIGSSYADSIELALFSACFTGAGIGIVGFSASGILAQWFEKWRGTALLIGMSGNGAGSFAYAVGLQAMFNYFSDQQALNENANDSDNKINAVYGDEWRYALRMCGSMSMLVVISVALFLRVPYLGEVELENPDAVKAVEVFVGDLDVPGWGITADTANMPKSHNLLRSAKDQLMNAMHGYIPTDEAQKKAFKDLDTAVMDCCLPVYEIDEQLSVLNGRINANLFLALSKMITSFKQEYESSKDVSMR